MADKEFLNHTQETLLRLGAAELIHLLGLDRNLRHVRQMAFQYWSKEEECEYQVHVLVTRDKGDFLEPFETEWVE